MRNLLALAVLGAALAACGEDAAQAPAPVPSAPRAKPPPAVAAPSSASVEYAYNPVNKRDPFRNLLADSPSTPAGGESGRVVCDEPLCQFDTDELLVVAVVSGDANPLAMVEDKTGVGHIVRRNTKIGKQGGKVTQVLRDCIVVTSFVTGADGRAQPDKQNMCVRPDVRSAPVLDLLDGKLRQ